MDKEKKITIEADAFDSLMWYATRYCIGRHSYCCSTAQQIWNAITTNRDMLNEGRLKFYARDIRSEISNVLRWHSNMLIENAFNDRIVFDAYSLYLDYMRQHPDTDPTHTKFRIDCISGEVETEPMGEGAHGSMTAFTYDTDLNCWVKLANCIDRQMTITAEYNGEVHTGDYVRILEFAGGYGNFGAIEERYFAVDNHNAFLPKDRIKTIEPKR